MFTVNKRISSDAEFRLPVEEKEKNKKKKNTVSHDSVYRETRSFRRFVNDFPPPSSLPSLSACVVHLFPGSNLWLTLPFFSLPPRYLECYS